MLTLPTLFTHCQADTITAIQWVVLYINIDGVVYHRIGTLYTTHVTDYSIGYLAHYIFLQDLVYNTILEDCCILLCYQTHSREDQRQAQVVLTRQRKIQADARTCDLLSCPNADWESFWTSIHIDDEPCSHSGFKNLRPSDKSVRHPEKPDCNLRRPGKPDCSAPHPR